MSNNGSLYSCDVTTWQCRIVSGFDKVARSSFGFVVTEEYIYITDTSRHSFKIFDKSGELVTDSRGTTVPLCYPNQLSLIDGNLYAADTNNHRIALINTTDSTEIRIETAIATVGNDDNYWKKIMSSRSLPSWCAPISDKIFGENGDAFLNREIDFNEKITPSAPNLARRGSIWPTAFEYDRKLVDIDQWQ